MIRKEYFCAAHGPFEGYEAVCPHGCTFTVERRFFTAPSVHTSGKTKITDMIFTRLAAQYGLSDLSNRNGAVAGGKQKGLQARWEPLPQGNVLEIGKGEVQRDGANGGATAAAAALGATRIADEPYATKEVPLPTAVPRPKANVVGRDTVSSADFAKAMERAT